MVRVGIIGAGFIGRNHFNQYEKMKARAPVVALCDKDADRRAGDWSKVLGNLADDKGSKRDLGNIRPYTEWQELLADPQIDLVDICAPTFLHRDITVAALKAGKHVLCEKPMALSVEACDEMIAAARQSGRKLMIAQCIRFWPEYVYLKRCHDSGEYGRLRALSLRRQAGTPDYSLGNWIVNPELSGGAVLDLHVHDVDFALHLFGKPDSVVAQGYHRPGGGVDRVHAQWFYPGVDRVTQLEGAWDLPMGYKFNMGFTAVFEGGAIVYDMNPDVPLTIHRPKADPLRPDLPTKDAYYGEIEHLLDCIETGKDPSISTPQESRDAVAIALAEKESALSGKRVEIG
jgi:predicted dehydrogenase